MIEIKLNSELLVSDKNYKNIHKSINELKQNCNVSDDE